MEPMVHPGGSDGGVAASSMSYGSVVPSVGAGTRSGSSTVAPAVAWPPGATDASPGRTQCPANMHGYLVAETTGLCNQAAYYHTATPAEPPCPRAEQPRKRWRQGRLVVETPHWPVTNLCDFAMAQANWSQQQPE